MYVKQKYGLAKEPVSWYNLVMRTKSYTKDYTRLRSGNQLRLPLNLEVLIPEDDSVRLLSHILEEFDYTELYKAYSPKGRKPAVEPKTLFKVIAYAYMNNIYSSRRIEQACRRDINFMWLLNGQAAPDHTTISRFRKHFLPRALDHLFYQLVNYLHDCGEIEFENVFVDGTKIEANANRYTFVWKKAVVKNEAKMLTKIETLIERINQDYEASFTVTKDSVLEDLNAVLNFLEKQRVALGIEFVYGKGRRKSQLQRYIEQLQDFYERQQQYNIHNELFDGRNSYSKTDKDATFMRLKDDHMKNAQLKPAYNVQIAVEAEYITGAGIFQERTDTTTLIPLLEMMEQNLGRRYQNVIADAGYESEENYSYLESKGITSYIKPQSYERSKKRSFKKDFSKRENMLYDPIHDEYTCHNQKRLRKVGTSYRSSATGYRSEITVYECEDCSDCPVKEKCTRAKGNRRLWVAKKFIEQRQRSLENITTEKGICLRMNRSIQVEGAYGVLKSDYNFRRFLTRGKNNVKTEFMLLCFGYNVNKFHSKIQNERLGMTLHELKASA